MAKIYSTNKKARFDYEILETYDAGIKLFGHEVKSIKRGSVNLQGSFVIIRGGEAYITNTIIPAYQAGNLTPNHEPERPLKLLLKKKEILGLQERLHNKGLTTVPLKLYNSRGLVKVEIGLVRGKKKYDKRDVIKKREADRKIRRRLN